MAQSIELFTNRQVGMHLGMLKLPLPVELLEVLVECGQVSCGVSARPNAVSTVAEQVM